MNTALPNFTEKRLSHLGYSAIPGLKRQLTLALFDKFEK